MAVVVDKVSSLHPSVIPLERKQPSMSTAEISAMIAYCRLCLSITKQRTKWQSGVSGASVSVLALGSHSKLKLDDGN